MTSDGTQYGMLVESTTTPFVPGMVTTWLDGILVAQVAGMTCGLDHDNGITTKLGTSTNELVGIAKT
jgi:hypothetical protein